MNAGSSGTGVEIQLHESFISVQVKEQRQSSVQHTLRWVQIPLEDGTVRKQKPGLV